MRKNKNNKHTDWTNVRINKFLISLLKVGFKEKYFSLDIMNTIGGEYLEKNFPKLSKLYEERRKLKNIKKDEA